MNRRGPGSYLPIIGLVVGLLLLVVVVLAVDNSDSSNDPDRPGTEAPAEDAPAKEE